MTQISIAPDIEDGLIHLSRQWFSSLATVGQVRRVATEVPASLPEVVGSGSGVFLRITLLGGRGTQLDVRPTVDFDFFATTHRAAKDLAWALDAKLMGFPHPIHIGEEFMLLDEVEAAMLPQRVPWADSTIRRFYSSYRISARR